MPRITRRTRFNKYSVGRASVLLAKGASNRQVAEHYFLRYADKWGVPSVEVMEQYLFGQKQGGNRPNFSRLFVGKTDQEMAAHFSEWLQKHTQIRHTHSRRMKRLHSKDDFTTRTTVGLDSWRQSPANKRQLATHARRLHQDPQANRKRIRRMRAGTRKQSVRAAKSQQTRVQHQTNPAFHQAAVAALNRARNASKARKGRSRAMKRMWKNRTAPELIQRIERIRATLRRHYARIRRGRLADFSERDRFFTLQDQDGKPYRVVANRKTPLQILIKREQRKLVRDAIRKLDGIDQRIIRKLFFENKPMDQVRTEVGLTENAFKSRLDLALQTLAQLIPQ